MTLTTRTALTLNQAPLAQRPLPEEDPWRTELPVEIGRTESPYAAVSELLGDRVHRMLIGPDTVHPPGEVVVPMGALFVLGDMRPLARDSRNFGPVPTDLVLGRAAFVWLSCAAPLFGNGWFCDPRTIRWARSGYAIR